MRLFPQWYVAECQAIARGYPDFEIEQNLLDKGILCFHGELVVRPPGGSRRHPVQLLYPSTTPFEYPVVTPIVEVPQLDDVGRMKEMPTAKYFDRRHQMPSGALCLFQRETRNVDGGEVIRGVDALKRAKAWFLGYHTGRWPPDSHESELESHFRYRGDILFSEILLGENLKNCGTFYMARDMRRLLDAVSEEDPPLIVTVATSKHNGIEAVVDAREDIKDVFPWLGNEAWSPEKIEEFEELNRNNEFRSLITEKGYWWSLNAEPTPFHSGKGLLDVLSSVAPNNDAWTMMLRTMGSDLTTRSKHFIGLRYPGRSGGNDWLVLNLNTADKNVVGGGVLLASDEDKRREFETASVGCYRVHGARLDDIQLRNSTVVDRGVRQKSVALIGLGALGSKVAELLAQAGVGDIRLCDGDSLSVGNVARHVGNIGDFGAKKVRVVQTRLYGINPHIKTSEILPHSATANYKTLGEFINGVDLVVCTTADENVESAVNQLAVIGKTAVVYGRAMRRGTIGRVFLVRPGIDACKLCLGRYAAANRTASRGDAWINVSEREDDVLLHECGRPVIPASAVNLSFVSSLTASTALDVLEGKDTETNHWLWSREAAVDVDQRLANPYSTLTAYYEPDIDCPACRNDEVTRVVLPATVEQSLRQQVESSISSETGGILIGHVSNQTAFVTRITGPGPKAKRTPVLLERDVEFVQAELDKATAELGDKGVYIGEWHSHLCPDPEPSARDIMSLCGIAEAPNYATDCPVMLIAGLNTEDGRVSIVKAWRFPIGGRMTSVPTANE